MKNINFILDSDGYHTCYIDGKLVFILNDDYFDLPKLINVANALDIRLNINIIEVINWRWEWELQDQFGQTVSLEDILPPELEKGKNLWNYIEPYIVNLSKYPVWPTNKYIY